MALSFDWLGRKKAQTLTQELNRISTENLALKAMHQFNIHSGQVNIMPDDPSTYLEQGYSGNTTVYSVVNRIDSMRKEAVLVIKDKAGKVVEGHELNRFITKVNNQLHTDDFITQLIVYHLIVGEHFVYKLAPTAGVNKGKVLELHVLPAADVEIIEGTMFDPVRGYKVEGNYNVEMEYKDVYHGKMFNPNWGKERSLHGMSPLRAASKTVSKLNQIEITETKAFENQGPPYILTKKNNDGQMRMSPEQQASYQKELKKASKAENRGMPTVLKDEFIKLDLGQKLADMVIIESSNNGKLAMCIVYNMPPELFGLGNATYNNMKEARKAAWTDCLIPLLGTVLNTLNSCLIEGVKEYEALGLHFDFDYSEIEELQEGMEMRVGWMNAAGWSGNDVLRATGKEASKNPLMDEPRLPMGVSFLSDYAETLDEGLKDFGDYLK